MSLAYARDPLPTCFDSYVDRYYNQFLVRDCKKTPGNNVRIMQHSNGMCILCVDPDNVALRKVRDSDGAVTVAAVTFGSGKGEFAPDSVKVVGKRKKNARVCQDDMKLCTLKLSDNSEYAIPACVNGFIIEMNAALLSQPWLVASAPLSEGFVAIINASAKTDLSTYEQVWTATGGDAQQEEEGGP